MKKTFLKPIARLLKTGENVIATSGAAPAPGRSTTSLPSMNKEQLKWE